MVDVAHDHHDGAAGLEVLFRVFLFHKQPVLNGDHHFLFHLGAEDVYKRQMLAALITRPTSLLYLRKRSIFRFIPIPPI